MADIYEKIKDKNIVIWGIGTMQQDLEGLYPFSNLLYYVNDDTVNNEFKSSKKRIFTPQKLTEEDKETVMVIVCTSNQTDAVSKLKDMGYRKEHYILVQEFFFDRSFYHQLHLEEILIWGMGDTYLWYEKEIKRHAGNILGFVVTEKEKEEFQGKPVYSIEELRYKKTKPYMIVASIYAEKIYASLLEMGMQPGKDFMHVKTLALLGNCASGINGDYQFDCRKKDEKGLVIVLAGYKPFIWESVFSRLEEYVPKNVDVCIVTSGLEQEDLKYMCVQHDWSYLSTAKNNVSLAVNIAISLHPEAEDIYKMDEDIFVTNGVFEAMKDTYQKVEKESRYEIGFVAPLVPVNGYGHVRLLELFDEVDLWEHLFGELKYTDCFWHHNVINHCPEAARFMWGEGNPKMDDLDNMQKILQKKPFQYSVCPFRYSIGFILFRRQNWLQMGTFQVLEYRNIGLDEEWICQFCMMQGRAMVIAENAVAGHLSYGNQNEAMKEYYDRHKKKFLSFPASDRN